MERNLQGSIVSVVNDFKIRIMKRLLLGLLVFVPFVMTAQSGTVTFRFQNQDGGAATGRVVTFAVSGKTVAENVSAAETYRVAVLELDTVTVASGRYWYAFPAAGTQDVLMTLNAKGKAVAIERNGEAVRLAQYRIPFQLYANWGGMGDNSQYTDLAEYLTGRIAGLVIDGGPGNYQAYLDGVVPLVVVDGLPVGSFNAANSLVRPGDIQSVSVDRDGTIYGTAGRNGVLVITTKR